MYIEKQIEVKINTLNGRAYKRLINKIKYMYKCIKKMRCVVLRGRVDFAGSRDSGRSWSVLVTPSVAQGVTPFLPLRGRTSALGEGQDTPLRR